MSDEKIKAIYLGRHFAESGKMCGHFVLPNQLVGVNVADELLIISSIFAIKKGRFPRSIGGEYEVDGTVTDGKLTQLVVNRAFKWLGQCPDILPFLPMLEARDEAERVGERAKKLEREYAEQDALGKLLKPLRSRYTSTDSIGKLALEVVFLNALRKR